MVAKFLPGLEPADTRLPEDASYHVAVFNTVCIKTIFWTQILYTKMCTWMLRKSNQQISSWTLHTIDSSLRLYED